MRQWHHAIPFKGGLWITGGIPCRHGKSDPRKNPLRVTEIIDSDGSVRRGPDLPGELKAGHCVVDLNDGRYMIIASTYSKTSNVLIYDTNKDRFTPAPSIMEGRMGHSCMLFRSPKHGHRLVVLVVGGLFDPGVHSEVLDFTQQDALWEPYAIHNKEGTSFLEPAVTRAVAYDNEVYAISEVLEKPKKHPDDDNHDGRLMMQRLIWKLSCNSSSCFWKTLRQEMVPANFGGTLMILPSRYTCQGASNKCPQSHPWAYLNGDYCCKYDMEKVYPPEGTTCDGSRIALNSTCCKDDAHAKCPHRDGCVNYVHAGVRVQE